jgi:hypothetical protein
MPNITDPHKKKKIKVTRIKVGPAPDKSKDGASMAFQRGKETKSYTPVDVRTGHPAYGKESSSKPTPKFIKTAQAAKQDVVVKNGLPYKAGTTETKKAPDKINYKIKVTPDIRPVKTTTETANTTLAQERKEKVVKLKARRMVAGGSDKNDHPANKVGVGTKSGFKIRKTTSFKK